MMKMDANCFDDDVDRGDQKGGIQGGAHRTAVYLDERCRYDRPSRPVNTSPERVSTNILVERGVECGSTLAYRHRQPLKSFRSPTRRPEIVLQWHTLGLLIDLAKLFPMFTKYLFYLFER